MRVTEQSKFLNLKRQVQRGTSEVQKSVEQLSTGKRLNRRDQDVAGSQTLDRLRRVTAEWRGYERAVVSVREQDSVTEMVLGDASAILRDAREVAVVWGSGPRTAAQLDAAAEEVEEIFEALRSVANTKVADEYVFSGTATDTEPFDAAGAYQGSGQRRSVEIQPGETLAQANGQAAFGVTAGVDAFGVLTGLAAALRAGDQQAVLAAGSDLEVAIEQVIAERQRIGSNLSALDQADAFREQMLIQFQGRSAEEGDADIAEAATRFQLAQTALQATVAVSGRLKSIDILGQL